MSTDYYGPEDILETMDGRIAFIATAVFAAQLAMPGLTTGTPEAHAKFAVEAAHALDRELQKGARARYMMERGL